MFVVDDVLESNGVGIDVEVDIMELFKDIKFRILDDVCLNFFMYILWIEINDKGIFEWFFSEMDFVWLVDGCYVFGCVGGGSLMFSYI